MNPISKTISKAVFIESIGTVVLASAFYALFFSLAETLDFFKALWFPILIGFLAMYFAGRWIGSFFRPTFEFKVWHGVAIIFVLLIVAVVASVLATSLLSNWDSLDIQDMFSVMLIFISFGGLPTLAVGIWLGNKLQKV